VDCLVKVLVDMSYMGGLTMSSYARQFTEKATDHSTNTGKSCLQTYRS